MNSALKTIREKKSMTQVQIARLSGITERSYQRIESGKVTTVDTAILIAHILNSTVEELFGSATTIEEKPGGNLPTDSTPCRVI